MKYQYYLTLLAYIRGERVNISWILPYIFRQNLESE